MKPSVTIAIPAYNAELFLKETIESCLSQTYPVFKIVIINDGSTDRTLEVAKEFAHHENIEIIDQKNNGKAESLNQIMASLSTDYLALMDSDDVALPDRIQKQVSFMESRPKLGASSSYLKYISAKGRVLGKMTSDLLSAEVGRNYEEKGDPFAIFCPSAILRKEVCLNEQLRFRGQFWPADDVDLWNRIYEADWDVYLQPEPLVKYRIHSLSAVTSDYMRTRKQFEFLRACMRARRAGKSEPTREDFEKHLKGLPKWEKFRRYRRNMAKASYRGAGFAFAQRAYFKAVFLIGKACLLQPIYTFRRLVTQWS